MSWKQIQYLVGMDVSKNRGGPLKSPILIGFFHYKPSIFGFFPSIFGNARMNTADRKNSGSHRTWSLRISPGHWWWQPKSRRCHTWVPTLWDIWRTRWDLQFGIATMEWRNIQQTKISQSWNACEGFWFCPNVGMRVDFWGFFIAIFRVLCGWKRFESQVSPDQSITFNWISNRSRIKVSPWKSTFRFQFYWDLFLVFETLMTC